MLGSVARRRLRRRFAYGIRAAFAAGAAVAASLALAAPQKQDLVIWGVSFGPDSKGAEAVVVEFQRRHPEYNVRVLSMGAGQMDPQKLMTSIVGDVAPDVIYQDRFTIGDWASRGAFMPLDDFLKNDKDPTAPKPSDYYPPCWEEAKFNGKQYGIPMVADDRILYWNRGIFREKAAALRAAGLDPDRPPRTWSELLAYSKVLTEYGQDGTLKRAGFMPNFGNSWLYLYALQNDAEFMSPDGRTCTLDTPGSENALSFMVKGYDLIGGYEQARSFETGFLGKENDAFIIGKVAMKIDGDWILADLVRYGPNVDLGVAPAPIPDDRYSGAGQFAHDKDKYITWIGGFCYAIPNGARNPKGGWEYIKFVTSTEGRLIEHRVQREWERRRGRSYIPRLAASMVANQMIFKEFKPADPKFAAAYKEHIDMLDHARIRPVTFVGQRLWDEHVRAIENACLHKMSPHDALLEGQLIVQRDLDAVFDQDKYPVISLNILSAILAVLFSAMVGGLVWAFKRQPRGALAKTEARWGLLLISPWLLGFVVFTFGPMVASLFFSLTQFNVLQPAHFVGFLNYHDMVTTDRDIVQKAFFNAIYLAGLGVPLGIVTGFAVALLLNTAARGIRFYRTIFYMPAIVPTIAAAILWLWMLYGDPNRGLINGLWVQTIQPWFHLPPPGWLNSESWSKPALVMMGLWGAGSGMILWLAGLKGIPATLYEAASLDGATGFKQFWSVTLPQLSPIVFFNLVMGFVGALQEFDRVYVMKPSKDGPIGPGDSMITPVYLLFKNGFGYFKMGFASSLAWAIFLLILLLTLIQFRLAPRWVKYEVNK